MKPSFLNHDKPLICAMIQCPTADECIEKIKMSLIDGAEAFGIQLERLKRTERSDEHLKRIFAACENKPIYITSYRYSENEGFTDDECAELLLRGLKCGATLCDVIGDIYGRSPYYELTVDEEAVKKQMALIDKIHSLGGEVLISSHTLKNITKGETVMIAKKHIERGADVVKIVNRAESMAEVPMYLEAIQEITAMTDKKLLLLVSGMGQIIRYVGPNFGVCMYLCVQAHGELDTPEQPLITDILSVRDHIKV